MPNTKSCSMCGLDVSNLPRTKDAQGRYYCQTCVAKAKAAQGAGTGTPSPASAKASSPAKAAGSVAASATDPMMDQLIAQAMGTAKSAQADAEATGPATCPGCSAAMSPGAMICLVCGYNCKTGKVIKTKVVAAPRENMGSKLSGVSMGTNTDWNEVARIAGGILLYFMVVVALCFVTPVAGIVLAISAIIYYLYYTIMMIVQPFLEGRVLWGLYHIVTLGLSILSMNYAVQHQEQAASGVPLLMTLPSVYYIFWKCENNKLKAIWLLSILLLAALVVAILVAGMTVVAFGGPKP